MFYNELKVIITFYVIIIGSSVVDSIEYQMFFYLLLCDSYSYITYTPLFILVYKQQLRFEITLLTTNMQIHA